MRENTFLCCYENLYSLSQVFRIVYFFFNIEHNKNKGEHPEKMSYSKEELKKRLTPMQYNVTQEAGTERPFTGKDCNFFLEVSANVF